MRKRRDPEATRRALQDAALQLFAELGYEGATVGRIARKARVNPALISYHFGGKRPLYLAILNESFSQLAGRLEAVRALKEPADRRLASFVLAFRDFFETRPAFAQLMMREAISGGRTLDPKIFPYFLRVFEVMRDILRSGVEEGRFRPASPILTQIGVVGTVLFFFASEGMRKRILTSLGEEADGVHADAFAEHWSDLITRGMAADWTQGALIHRDQPPATGHASRRPTEGTENGA